MAVQEVKCQKPFKMNAYVILPDHLHMIWTLPKNDSNYSDRWKKIKALFSKSLIKSGVNLSKSRHNEYHLWTRRFWEHTVRHDADYENYVNYIHYNPIKHGLVDDLKNWPYSSFHHFVRAGLIDENWGSSVIQLVDGDCFGE